MQGRAASKQRCEGRLTVEAASPLPAMTARHVYARERQCPRQALDWWVNRAGECGWTLRCWGATIRSIKVITSGVELLQRVHPLWHAMHMLVSAHMQLARRAALLAGNQSLRRQLCTPHIEFLRAPMPQECRCTDEQANSAMRTHCAAGGHPPERR
jgi:hypothetical protein